MVRIAVIGNSGGGKSTLARALAAHTGLPYVEVDRLLWQEGWVLTPTDIYIREHKTIIDSENWVIDGLGQQASLPERLARATEIILVDMPLWMHFWLAAERQIAWTQGSLDNTPGGIASMPPTRALFKTIWDVEQTWMPGIRKLCETEEHRGKKVTRIQTVEELDDLVRERAS